MITNLPVGYAVLAASLAQLALLGAVCILGPLWSERSRLRGHPGRLRLFTCFAMLGAGFMSIEITSLQTFTVFLGAPIYSMAITLASLLVATGVGALWSGQRGEPPERLVRNAVLGIAIWAILTSVMMDPLLEATLGWPLLARAVLTAGWLFPVGLVLGVPFPTAIRCLQSETPALVPWAWGINACASVVAALAVILVSMQLGFRTTLLLPAALYWLGYCTSSCVLGRIVRSS